MYVYHGKGRGVKAQQLARYSCVLTTYTSMGMEAPPRAHPKQGAHSDLPIPLEADFDDSITGTQKMCTVANKWCCLLANWLLQQSDTKHIVIT